MFILNLDCGLPLFINKPKTDYAKAVACKGANITKILVWNVMANNTKKGNWFDVTDKIRTYFPTYGILTVRLHLKYILVYVHE